MMTEDDNEVSYLLSERTRLHWAVFRNDIEQLKIFLQNGEDPNTQDIVGSSPLHYLSSHNSEMVETLVNHGANVNLKNQYNRTPLHGLVSNIEPYLRNVQLKYVKMLLENGANVNSQDYKGSTPLHDLVRCSDWQTSDDGICDLLLGYEANVQLQDVDGCTALHLAVCKRPGIVAKLLESTSGKSAVNIPDKSGDYPLHTAIRKKSFRMIELLIDNGARINCKNKYNRTPLHGLVSNIEPCLRDVSLKYVKMLLEKGANVNSQDCKGSTPLHDFVRCSDWKTSDDDICDLLLSYGANVQLQDLDGCTPLHLAVRVKLELTARLLESNSGKRAVNIPDKSGDYPLHTATRKLSLKMLKLLLDNGARINCKNGKGQTALHLSSIRMFLFSTKSVVELLLERGAEVNSQDKKGRTSLDHAVKRCVQFPSYLQYRSSALHQHIPILLDWGASFGVEDASWKSQIDSSPFFIDQKNHEIRKTCLGLPPNVTQVSTAYEFQSYVKDCRTEVNKMKAELHGSIFLYDIFQQQFDPLFLLNEDLVSTLQSTNLDDHYPIYASLIISTYHRCKERVQLFETVSTILQTPLPFEVIRYILTFVDNESLRNVIKAKELL